MELKNIIIAELNKLNAYSDFYTGEHKYIDETEKVLCEKIQNLYPNIKVDLAYKFEDINNLLNNNDNGKTLIISNFPANNTYKRYKTSTKDGVKTYMADGYNISEQNFKTLLKAKENIVLHIITGASESLISDKNIKSLSDKHRIAVKRKKDFIYKSSSYSELLEKYIIEIINTENQI